ncbi:MAG: cytochrome ubiquinol oxidase subunit I, partial [Phycisphaerae bacterium]|nr:cytochrome ubiquinol oxidase subunit I [Phycisphaerae bacterium]
MLTAIPSLLGNSSLLPSRLQMAVTLAFHITFAAVGIGLPLLMVISERLYLRTGKVHYRSLAQKWSKATAVLFAIGAVSGTALSFELGLLWPRYMQITGAAVGHLFGLEGFAFFLEAIFLGLYIYGWDRLPPKGHFWCGVAIAFFGALSGWLVLGVNAWMQLPVGVQLDSAGNVTSVNPFAIFRTYAWFTMALHSTLACYIAVSFAVAAVYAAGYLKGRRDDYHRFAIRIAMTVGTVVALLQPISGDLIAKFVYRTQPAKFAAMEAHFETSRYAPAFIGGIPDVDSGTVRFAIPLPGVLSFLATGDPSSEIKGLNDIDRSLWPNVALVHVSFQIMVGLGVVLMILGIWFALAT